MKTDEAECQDFADLGDAFVRCHKFWLQWIHDQSPYRRLKMIAPERSENRNQMISEALRRRKQRSENARSSTKFLSDASRRQLRVRLRTTGSDRPTGYMFVGVGSAMVTGVREDPRNQARSPAKPVPRGS
jgi:hypothetical protein